MAGNPEYTLLEEQNADNMGICQWAGGVAKGICTTTIE